MNAALIDHEILRELEDATGAEFAAELIGTFLDEAPGMLAELKDAARRQDADGFRRAAHSLKSNAATFGADELAEMARRIELGELSSGEAELPALEAVLDRTMSALRDFPDA